LKYLLTKKQLNAKDAKIKNTYSSIIKYTQRTQSEKLKSFSSDSRIVPLAAL